MKATVKTTRDGQTSPSSPNSPFKPADNALVMEEEDDEIVNTKMQLANGEEIFVGDYEIEQQQ